MLYVRKVLVVIKSGEKNKLMDQGGRGWWEKRRKKPAKINREPGWEGWWEERRKNSPKINRGDGSSTRSLGVKMSLYVLAFMRKKIGRTQFKKKAVRTQIPQ